MKLAPIAGLGLLFFSPAALAEDAEGCKDHALFTRMPNMTLAECKGSQFDAKKFPVGPPLKPNTRVPAASASSSGVMGSRR